MDSVTWKICLCIKLSTQIKYNILHNLCTNNYIFTSFKENGTSNCNSNLVFILYSENV